MRALVLAISLLAILGVTRAAHAAKVDLETRAAAAKGASVRVLVMLQEAPEALRKSESLSARVARIQLQVDAVLSALPAPEYTVRRRFQAVPGVAIDTRKAGLDLLERDPRVHSVGLDLGGLAQERLRLTQPLCLISLARCKRSAWTVPA